MGSKLLLFTLSLMALLVLASSGHAYLSGYDWVRPLTITTTSTGNYTAKLLLENWTNIYQDNMNDIRITDCVGNVISQQVGYKNSTNILLTINHNFLVAGVNNLCILYGSTTAVESSNPNAVFGDGIKGVFQFPEDSGTNTQDSLWIHNATGNAGVSLGGGSATYTLGSLLSNDLFVDAVGGLGTGTICARLTDTKGASDSVYWSRGDASDTYTYRQAADGLRFAMTATFIDNSSATPMNNANQHFVCGWKSTTNGTMLYDGAQVGTGTSFAATFANSAGDDMYIGKYWAGGDTLNFTGVYYDFYVWNTSLPFASITNLNRTITNYSIGAETATNNFINVLGQSYNASAYETTNQTLGVLIQFNNSVYSNITDVHVAWNGTNYTVDTIVNNTNGDLTNLTFNKTLSIPLIQTNATSITFNWSYTGVYPNASEENYTITSNVQEIDFAYFITNVNTSKPYIIESDISWVYANTTEINSLATLTKILTYNVTNYTDYSETIIAPLVSADTNVTINAWLTATYNGNTRIMNLSTQQKIFDVSFNYCGGSYTTVIMNISSVYETNSSSIQSDLQFYAYNDYLNTSGIYFYNQTSFEICSSISWTNLTMNIDMLYGGGNTSLAQRGRYLRGLEISNNTYNLTVNNVYSSDASQLQLSVVDSNAQQASNRIVVAKKSYLPNNSYFAVDSCTTNSNGVCYVQLITNDYYRFDIENNTDGTLEYSTDKAQVTSTEITNGYSITISSTGQLNYYYYTDDATVAFSYDTSTNITALTVASTQGYDVDVVLMIVKNSFLNDSVIYYNTGSSSNVILWAMINDTDNSDYTVYYNVSYPNIFNLTFTPYKISYAVPFSYGDDFFFAIFLFITFMALLKTGSVWTILFAVLAFLISASLNFLNILGEAGNWVLGIAAIGLLVIMVVKNK